MTMSQLVVRLLEFGRANSVPGLVDAAPYLEALAVRFGDRDPREVSAGGLCALHRDAGPELTEPVEAGLRRKSLGWEAIYSSRARALLGPRQWESPTPVGALVELFEDPGFRPETALELGCGDGVNAVFMASRGCRVTAVDVSTTAIEMARSKAAEAGVDVDFLVGDVFGLARAAEPYD